MDVNVLFSCSLACAQHQDSCMGRGTDILEGNMGEQVECTAVRMQSRQTEAVCMCWGTGKTSQGKQNTERVLYCSIQILGHEGLARMERWLRDMLVQDEETKRLETFAFRTGRDIGYLPASSCWDWVTVNFLVELKLTEHNWFNIFTEILFKNNEEEWGKYLYGKWFTKLVSPKSDR